ncbi:hypothetical protein HHL17_09700 [Chitinophaga sp. G-6-1-13]|uniref:Uncharacterized protein n=1 Tax=Chitinophaga fulva TaxID=2728842 RepID=A0A848GFQ5_9BACT|nr:hypothetical protein [Chitinophaga fulva]NML37465.1 hypothetical protein [Chitinophaga fulva]
MKVYIILLFALMSCNKALLVPQKDVIRNQKGYIVFYYENEEALFFPWTDTVDARFLSRDHVNGYRIDKNVKQLEYIKELAIDQRITKNVLQSGHSIQVDEIVKLLPVNVKFYWGEGWRLRKITRNGKKVNIKYMFSNKDIELTYNVYDDRQIMSIVPVRESDKIRVKEAEPKDLSN